MDKDVLVKRLRQAFAELEQEGFVAQSVHLIPPQLLFKAKSFILVVSSSAFERLTVLEKTRKLRELVTAKLDDDTRQHINMMWAFDSAAEAMERIDLEVGDETYLITPVLEPAHA